MLDSLDSLNSLDSLDSLEILEIPDSYVYSKVCNKCTVYAY